MKKHSLKPLFWTGPALCIAALLTFACGRGGKEEDLRGELAALSGKMAAQNDLREVLNKDLNHDGTREVIMLFGPRETLDFDVFYRTESGEWHITPLVNDQNNPREFVGTHLESIGGAGGDSIPLITVSSRLYDGNTMVKDIQWSPSGYRVVNQRTVVAGAPLIPPSPRSEAGSAAAARPKSQVASRTEQKPEAAAAAKTAEPVKKAEPAKPKPKPIPPQIPETGTYIVRKGDTVFGIAGALGVPVERLEALNDNQLQRRGLRIGQRIDLPVPGGKNANVSVSIEKERYTVKSGDNLISIAEHFGTTVQALRSWNPALPEDGSIKVGQALSIHHARLEIKS